MGACARNEVPESAGMERPSRSVPVGYTQRAQHRAVTRPRPLSCLIGVEAPQAIREATGGRQGTCSGPTALRKRGPSKSERTVYEDNGNEA